MVVDALFTMDVDRASLYHLGWKWVTQFFANLTNDLLDVVLANRCVLWDIWTCLWLWLLLVVPILPQVGIRLVIPHVYAHRRGTLVEAHLLADGPNGSDRARRRDGRVSPSGADDAGAVVAVGYSHPPGSRGSRVPGVP